MQELEENNQAYRVRRHNISVVFSQRHTALSSRASVTVTSLSGLMVTVLPGQRIITTRCRAVESRRFWVSLRSRPGFSFRDRAIFPPPRMVLG